MPAVHNFARKHSSSGKFGEIKIVRERTDTILETMPRNIQNDNNKSREVNQWVFIAPGL